MATIPIERLTEINGIFRTGIQILLLPCDLAEPGCLRSILTHYRANGELPAFAKTIRPGELEAYIAVLQCCYPTPEDCSEQKQKLAKLAAQWGIPEEKLISWVQKHLL